MPPSGRDPHHSRGDVVSPKAVYSRILASSSNTVYKAWEQCDTCKTRWRARRYQVSTNQKHKLQHNDLDKLLRHKWVTQGKG